MGLKRLFGSPGRGKPKQANLGCLAASEGQGGTGAPKRGTCPQTRFLGFLSFMSCAVLCCLVLSCVVLCCLVFSVLCCVVLWCGMLCCVVLRCGVLCTVCCVLLSRVVVWCRVLCCLVLWCGVLCAVFCCVVFYYVQILTTRTRS